METLTVKQKKLYEKKVYTILKDQDFVIGDKEKLIIEERISNGRRYFFMVASRIENGIEIDRFVKIPQNNAKKLLLPFQRQIEFSKYLKTNKIINTRGVVSANYDPKKGIPFAIMETFPKDNSKIGFIENNRGVELLTRREAENTVNQIEKFSEIQIESLPGTLRKVLKKYKGDYESLKKEIYKSLNKNRPFLSLTECVNKAPPESHIAVPMQWHTGCQCV